MPVAVTTIVAVPRVTAVFWNSMLDRSPTATSALRRAHAASLATGALSPVSAASCVSSVAERTIAAVGGDDVARLELDDVAGNDLGRRRRAPPTPSRTHLRLRHLQVRERVDARPRLQLLTGPEHQVEQDQERDDHARSRPRRSARLTADDRDEHDVHRLAQLLRAPPTTATAAPRRDLVRPVPRQPRRRLGRRSGRWRPSSEPRAAGARRPSRACGGGRLTSAEARVAERPLGSLPPFVHPSSGAD